MRRITLLVLAGLLAFGNANAGGWLGGASVGSAKQYDYSVGGPIATTDDSDTAFRAFGGYMFHSNFGVVGSYVDLGEAFYDGPAFGGFTDTLSADGFDISFLAGWAPGGQERVSLFAVVGMFIWEQDVLYIDSSGTYPYSDSGTSMSYGAGADVSVGSTAKWGLHFEYQRFMDVGDNNNSGHEYDRSFVSAGFDYRFGK